MKLELKHLQAYKLGKNGIKVKANGSLWEVASIHFDEEVVELMNNHNAGTYEYLLEDIELVLVPLSDLTKEIERNKTFLHKIAIDLGLLKDDNFLFRYDFSDSGSYGDKYDYSILAPSYTYKLISIPQKTKDVKNVSYNVMEKLFEYHFDVFGLIEAGLAIDLNTL